MLDDDHSVAVVGLGNCWIPTTPEVNRSERETRRAVGESDVPCDQLYVVALLPNLDHGCSRGPDARQPSDRLPRIGAGHRRTSSPEAPPDTERHRAQRRRRHLRRSSGTGVD
ncbi:conserved hypothetical protein [Mycobacterium ulcerans Agy99]|uniref:Uncharacterized protein n=1 Tax=Mycobacterium ulcerans (strain Agy99) TaxID=362242 RepID=A0PQ12_MYCUA|nr:conserved hypothetical protein [Mycobacterium ulcerans Agy99]OIN17608.1 hypothetical protein A3649_09200 [Mycobacterium ulcerans]